MDGYRHSCQLPTACDWGAADAFSVSALCGDVVAMRVLIRP